MKKVTSCSINKDSNSCHNCAQRRLTMFTGFGNDALDQLESERYVVKYKKGESIFKAGTKPTGLFCISNGKVKILRHGPAGTDQIVGLRKNGDFIGLRAIIKNRNHSISAVAIEECEVCIIPTEVFKQVLIDDQEFNLKITEYFIDKLEESERLHINHSQKHMRARLVDALLNIKKVYGLNSDGYLNASLKRAELAAMANMTTENVIRILSSFASENLIDLNGRKIKVKNQAKLEFLSIAGR